MRLRLLLFAVGILGLSVWATSATADPTAGPPICSSAGTALSGSYPSLTVTGNAYVPAGDTLTVGRNLTLTPGSCLDAFSLSTVKVGGDVLVGRTATLALGCSPGALGPPIPQPPCGVTTTTDWVGGSILADRALTMYLTDVTVRGSVVSIGGGPGRTLNPYINFPIKENTIGGNLIVEGWQGAWFGVIRNHVSGNVLLFRNVGLTTGDGGTPDSTEVVSNTVGGSLICLANNPMAQVGDSGGGPNSVAGLKLGECAGL